MNAEWFTNVVIIFVLTINFAVKSSTSAIHFKEKRKYFNRKLHVKQHVPRRSGILETVQAIPTSTTPTARDSARVLARASARVSALVSARVNTPANSTKDSVKNLDSVNNTLADKANFSSPVNGSAAPNNMTIVQNATNRLQNLASFSSPVNDNTATNNVTVVQNATNRLQNLASYSLDQPNSFPRPTSIPAIDTMSAAWPTPMGSIDNEMDDAGNPPSLQPIESEMSSEEKIPGIQEISNMARIPLDFQEEPPWERSHATAANVTAGHATHGHARFSLGHAASRHFVPSPSRSIKKLLSVKSRKIIRAYAKGQKENVAANLKGSSKIRNTSFKVNKFGKEKLRSQTQNIFKHKESQNGAKRSKEGKHKKWRKRVSIPPPKAIDPIQPLLEKFQKEKEVGDIKEHTVDIKAIKPNEGIDKHLVSLESQPKIKPITEHLSKEKPDDIEPIENHQLVENAK
ncbi:hypothetical protein ACROYT_G035358 [Oculina patagonica]